MIIHATCTERRSLVLRPFRQNWRRERPGNEARTSQVETELTPDQTGEIGLEWGRGDSDGGEVKENCVREEENELLSCTQTLQVSVL